MCVTFFFRITHQSSIRRLLLLRPPHRADDGQQHAHVPQGVRAVAGRNRPGRVQHEPAERPTDDGLAHTLGRKVVHVLLQQVDGHAPSHKETPRQGRQEPRRRALEVQRVGGAELPGQKIKRKAGGLGVALHRREGSDGAEAADDERRNIQP